MGNQVFTKTQEELLNGILNRLIPPEDDLPGAGDLGLASYIDPVVAESSDLIRLFLAGLDYLDIAEQETTGRPFGMLSTLEKDETLIRLQATHTEFFDTLLQHTYNGYYTKAGILSLIGHEARPPQPLGYPMKPFDPRLLDNVRERGRLYRDV